MLKPVPESSGGRLRAVTAITKGGTIAAATPRPNTEINKGMLYVYAIEINVKDIKSEPVTMNGFSLPDLSEAQPKTGTKQTAEYITRLAKRLA
jgi:hypothetical protein